MSPLLVAVAGAAAGAVGALAPTVVIVLGRRTLRKERADRAPQPEGWTPGRALAEGPEMAPDFSGATATFVQKLATGIFGVSLSAREQMWAGTAWHLLYGAFWGTWYALLVTSLDISPFAVAAVLAIGVWLLGPVWLMPKMRLMVPVRRQRLLVAALVLAGHVAYGAIAAVTFALLWGAVS
jgi:hypothetical protein